MEITANQCGFVRNMPVTDEMHVFCLFSENHRKKRRTVGAIRNTDGIFLARIKHDVYRWKAHLKQHSLKLNAEKTKFGAHAGDLAKVDEPLRGVISFRKLRTMSQVK